MSEWISVKKALPLNETFIKVKSCILFRSTYDAFFINKYFIRQGENITNWVTHWMPENDR